MVKAKLRGKVITSSDFFTLIKNENKWAKHIFKELA